MSRPLEATSKNSRRSSELSEMPKHHLEAQLSSPRSKELGKTSPVIWQLSTAKREQELLENSTRDQSNELFSSELSLPELSEENLLLIKRANKSLKPKRNSVTSPSANTALEHDCPLFKSPNIFMKKSSTTKTLNKNLSYLLIIVNCPSEVNLNLKDECIKFR